LDWALDSDLRVEVDVVELLALDVVQRHRQDLRVAVDLADAVELQPFEGRAVLLHALRHRDELRLAGTLGPTLGGFLTDTFSWHWLFLVNIVPGFAVAAVVWLTIDIDKPDLSLLRHFDLIGMLLMAVFLAAPRIEVLGVEGLAALLDRNFPQSTARRRTVMPRHRTMRAVLDWSYGLLSEDEQRFFRALGIFAGGFTVEAAAAVAIRRRSPLLCGGGC
jgi:hypothetical protein